VILIILKFLQITLNKLMSLDAKVDIEVDNVHVKRTDIEYLVSYVYIVRVDKESKN
jgi:hypothetical protein